MVRIMLWKKGIRMANNEGKYNIKAASKKLGIQPGTLRAWERRYQIIAPVRNESGHRLYTEEHMRILTWLIQKVNKGFTISQAVALLEKNNYALIDADTASANDKQEDLSSDLLHQLLSALLEFDEGTAHELMDRIFSLYSVDKVLVDILGTLLVKIGDMWERMKLQVLMNILLLLFYARELESFYTGYLLMDFYLKPFRYADLENGMSSAY